MRRFKSIIKIFICMVLIVLTCTQINVFEVFAVNVSQDQIGIYCIKDNGYRATNEWVEIDFEGDYYLEYYYFDLNGYLVMNGTTPDGYTVNERGQWVINGKVQRKHYQLSNSTKYDEDEINVAKANKYETNSGDGVTSIGIFLAILSIVVILLVLALTSEKSYYDEGHYYKHKYDDYDDKKQSYNENKKIQSNDTTVQRNIWWHLRSDTDKIGDKGEDEVAVKLAYIGSRFIVLRNINLPRKNKKDVQIDFLCISNKGIFVIEVKNWLGEVSGKYGDEKWYSQKYDIINEQTNPVRQNEWHVDVLKRIIKQNISFYSIIVFTDRSNISRLSRKCNKTYILNISNLNNVINDIYESSNVLPYSNYKSIAGYLRKFV